MSYRYYLRKTLYTHQANRSSLTDWIACGMRLQQGDIWTALEDPRAVICVPANSFIRKNGELTMGAGFALAAAQHYPHLARQAGFALGFSGLHLRRFGFRIVTNSPKTDGKPTYVGLFQTKLHFKDPSSVDLIAESTDQLRQYALKGKHHTVLHLPFPGVGLGGLAEAEVMPILEDLPDNVVIWTR